MITVDYDAIVKNALYFKRLLGNSMLCAVVKNNAYGHGILHTARYLAPLADMFAVGSVEEAEAISFLNKETMILIPQDVLGAKKAVDSGFILNIDSFDSLNAAEAAASSVGKTARAHVKIDSGMNRLGFRFEDMKKLVPRLNSSFKINVEGVFSHFYKDTPTECEEQFEYFMHCGEILQKGLQKKLIKHIANTSGALLEERYRLDMSRIGLGLYGYGNCNLLPSKEVSAKVIAVKDVASNDSVGYGAVYRPRRSTRIAVIDYGYADGLARVLRGEKILINGAVCPVVAVCMAMSMVDVKEAEVSVGDKAVLMGKNVNMSNDDIIVYELLCNLRK